MAKFTTNVAGVTHYSVDFSSIRKSSSVEIVPEPECPYDSNALKVVINGRQVGYIKKGFNKSISKAIKEGSKVTARVKAVVGGGGDYNHGIVLTLVVNDGYTEVRKNNDLGKVDRSKSLEIKVKRSNRPAFKISNIDDLWIKFLKEKKNLQDFLDLPKEPDYRAKYDKEVPLLTRVWRESFESYRDRLRDEWLKDLRDKQERNSKTEKVLEELNGKRNSGSFEEFDSYVNGSRLNELFQAVRLAIGSKTDSRISQYVTVYEHSVYDALKLRIKNVYHQAKIDGISIDIICIPSSMSAVWAIEIDGGIHRQKIKVDRDSEVERRLNNLGVSLIRIPNHLISKSVNNCIDKILEIIETNGRIGV